MITRTITGTRVTVISVNPLSLIATKKTVDIRGTFEENDKLLKALKTLYDNETEIISSVLSSEKFEELYGLEDDIFMEYAVKLDPKTRKPLDIVKPAPFGNPVSGASPEVASEPAPKADIEKKE